MFNDKCKDCKFFFNNSNYSMCTYILHKERHRPCTIEDCTCFEEKGDRVWIGNQDYKTQPFGYKLY